MKSLFAGICLVISLSFFVSAQESSAEKLVFQLTVPTSDAEPGFSIVRWVHFIEEPSLVLAYDGINIQGVNAANGEIVFEVSQELLDYNNPKAVFLTRDSEGAIYSRDARTGQEILQLSTYPPFFDAKYSPDGQNIVAAFDKEDEQYIGIFEATTGAEVFSFLPQASYNYPMERVGYSPDGSQILAMNESRYILVYDAQTGTLLREFLPDMSVDSIQYSPNGRTVSILSEESRAIIVMDILTGQSIRLDNLLILPPYFSYLYWDRGFTFGDFFKTVGYSPDGLTLLVRSNDDYFVKMLDASTLQQTGEIQLNALAIYSPGGKFIATGDNYGEVKIRDATTGEVAYVFNGHQTPITDIKFSQDGRFLITLSEDSVVSVWDVADLAEQDGVQIVQSTPQQKRGVFFSTSPDVSNTLTNPFIAVVPPDWITSPSELPRYEIKFISSNNVLLQTCAYQELGTGNTVERTRIRIDLQVSVVDLETGVEIASRNFQGRQPATCPASITTSSTSDESYFGYPDETQFVNWLTGLNLDMEAMPETTPVPAETGCSGTISSASATVNMRSGPGTEFEILRRISNGAEVQILAEQAGWYQVIHDDLQGWISAELIRTDCNF